MAAMTAPTSNERREVAASLREQVRYMRENNCYEEDLNVVDCGNSAYRNIAWSVEPYGNFEKGNYAHIVDRLADLIDPTCEVSSVETYYDELGQLDGWEFHLTCGHSVKRPYYEAPSYCPECGARVVES